MPKDTRERPEFPVRVKAGVALAALLALWGSLEFYGLQAEAAKIKDPFLIRA